MNHLNPRAIIFDFIGTTVIETKPDIISSCFQNAFRKNGIDVPESFIQSNRGRNKQDVIQDALKTYSPLKDPGSILLDFENSLENQLQYFEGAPNVNDVFESLRSKGIPIALASGLPNDLFNKIIDTIGFAPNWFDYRKTYEEIGRGRPHPDLIFDLMENLRIQNAKELIKVGDTVADIEEGKNAGAVTIALLAKTQPDELLIKAKPDFRISNLIDILEIV